MLMEVGHWSLALPALVLNPPVFALVLTCCLAARLPTSNSPAGGA